MLNLSETRLPSYVPLLFLATVFLVAFLVGVGFTKVGFDRRTTFLALAGWLGLSGVLAASGFFVASADGPPRFLLGVLPPMAVVVALVASPRTRELLASLPLAWVVGAQVFRVPVEIVLWEMGRAELVPAAMTFEGSNFDVVTGLSAPLVAMLCFRKGVRHQWLAAVWNVMGFGLLVNVVSIAVRTSPRFAAPGTVTNRLPEIFPFAWLPYFLVPVALLGHLVTAVHLYRRARVK